MKKLLKHIIFLLLVVMGISCTNEEQQSPNPEEATPVPFSAIHVDEPNNLRSNAPAETIELSRENAITRAVDKASSSVVSIMTRQPVRRFESAQDEFLRYFFGGQLPQENTNVGSGFIISEDGLVVTNQHVVGSNPSEITISTVEGAMYEGELVGFDELTDIALIRIKEDEVFPFVTLSDSDDVIVGEWAIALGNPFGLFEDGQPTATVGVISAKNRDFSPDPNNPRVYIDMLQTDAAINRGNSGGPLLNSNGEVIGMNTFIYTGGTSAGFVGLSFAIPSNRIERIITQLLTSGVVILDYDPGMEFTSMTEQLYYRYRLPYVRGLLVTSVNRGGPAFECGIMPGDVIVKIGEERVVSEMHAWALLRDYDVGDSMKVELIRENELYETEMYLRQRVSAK